MAHCAATADREPCDFVVRRRARRPDLPFQRAMDSYSGNEEPPASAGRRYGRTRAPVHSAALVFIGVTLRPCAGVARFKPRLAFHPEGREPRIGRNERSLGSWK